MKGRSHDMIKPGGLGLFLIRNAFDENRITFTNAAAQSWC